MFFFLMVESESCGFYLLIDDVDPRGGTVAEVGPLEVPVSFWAQAHE